MELLRILRDVRDLRVAEKDIHRQGQAIYGVKRQFKSGHSFLCSWMLEASCGYEVQSIKVPFLAFPSSQHGPFMDIEHCGSTGIQRSVFSG